MHSMKALHAAARKPVLHLSLTARPRAMDAAF